MTNWGFYTAALAMAVSVVALSRLALVHHEPRQPRNLSELAAAEDDLLKNFRGVLWLCGTLFACVVYGFVVQRIRHPIPVVIAWSMTYLGDLLLAIIPARDRHMRLHNICAEIMAIGMLAMAYLYWIDLSGWAAITEAVIAIVMTALGAATALDKRRFIFYELAFIYLSHASIVIAVIAA